MRAVVLEADETLRLDDRPPPSVGPEEVLVTMTTSGICGTDLSIYSGNIPVRHPLIMGHEMCGRLAAAPEGFPLNVEARVLIDPSMSCGACFWCSKGETNICPNGALLGRDRDGGFADQIAVPAANVHEVPDVISDRAAPLLQVLAVCIHGQRSAPLEGGGSVLILGLGVSGLLHLQIARSRGADKLIGVTRSASKRALAEQLGADLTLDPADPDLKAKVVELTDGRGPDIVIDCAGKVETLASAIDLVRPGGHVVLFGTITAGQGALPFYSLYLKELTITNPRSAKPDDFPAAIELVASGRVVLESLITNILPLEGLEEAIGMTKNSATLKVILEHGGPH